MKRKIHPRVKIFFPNPHVVRVDHEDEPSVLVEELNPDFRDMKSKAYKCIQGTWGYSAPTYEFESQDLEGMNKLQRLAAMFGNGARFLRSYWCFSDEMDALQFRLMIGSKATRVYMWPERMFTIHEYIEDNKQSS